ncbi:hypothetical protein NUW54_g2410 [Trametes sanguinea]|uniref:Uncharacterized protein n=1 Tax=Trametes sanguinea TaxID=158606 RepID=A0ACC1Q5J0_9APHY|nr:hypothetical protein NUW54_g2410 [Trametes sanguinea]
MMSSPHSTLRILPGIATSTSIASIPFALGHPATAPCEMSGMHGDASQCVTNAKLLHEHACNKPIAPSVMNSTPACARVSSASHLTRRVLSLARPIKHPYGDTYVTSRDTYTALSMMV